MLCAQCRDGTDSEPNRLRALSRAVRSDTAEPVEEARRVLSTANPNSTFEFVRQGEPLSVSDGPIEWTVHPVLFEAEDRTVAINHWFDTVEWLPPTEFLTRNTISGLWESYRRVAPDVDLIRTDETHGATWLSIRALEVLRDTAGAIAFGTAEGGSERIESLARELRDARPSMVVIQHRIDRVMDTPTRTPEAIHDRAVDVIDAAIDADRLAAEQAAGVIADTSGRVATLSRSGTVTEAVQRVGSAAVVAESRPAREGVTTAERLAAAGLDVTLTTDAALPGLLRDRDIGCVLLGADRVLPNGDVANKVGSYPLVLAAADADIPVYVVAAADKIATTDEVITETGESSTVYDGDGAVAVANPIFERVPGDLIRGIVTEDGILDRTGIASRARKHESMSSWIERSG